MVADSPLSFLDCFNPPVRLENQQRWRNQYWPSYLVDFLFFQGILGSGFALKVQQKQRQKHFNRQQSIISNSFSWQKQIYIGVWIRFVLMMKSRQNPATALKDLKQLILDFKFNQKIFVLMLTSRQIPAAAGLIQCLWRCYAADKSFQSKVWRQNPKSKIFLKKIGFPGNVEVWEKASLKEEEKIVTRIWFAGNVEVWEKKYFWRRFDF